jgi:hypothetical protein
MPTEVDVEPVSLELLGDIAWMASFDEEDVEEEPYEASNYCAYVYVPETKSWRKVMDAEKERVSNVVYAYPITHAQALKGPHAEDADPAVKEELQNIDRNGVFNPVAYSSLSKDDINAAIPSGLYIKYKMDAGNGAYLKSKARLHGGGHRQKPELYNDTASYMINIFVVFFVLKVMAALGLEHAVYDIKGAYLHVPRRHPRRQIMKLTPRLTALWIEIHPEHAQYVHEDGCLYVELLKALYGLKDSGAEWFHYLNEFLHRHGFISQQSDPCLYCKRVSATDFAYVLTHVDDLFLVGLGQTFLTFGRVLATSFPDVTTQLSDTFTYLGMGIVRDRANHAVLIS